MGRKPIKPRSPFDILKDVKLTPKAPTSATPTPTSASGARKPGAHTTRPSADALARATEPDPATEGETARGPATLPGRDYAERVAIRNAYAGVRKLDAKGDAPRPVRPAQKPPEQIAARAQRDAEARARLDAFVGQARRFVVERNGDDVRGRRDDMSIAQASQLFARDKAPEQKLDLHGLRAEDAARQVVTFTRAAQRAGKRTVLIVHGRGQHSAGGVGVLPEVVLETLSRGGAAPVVRAFMTAPQRLGGIGAMLVFLTEN